MLIDFLAPKVLRNRLAYGEKTWKIKERTTNIVAFRSLIHGEEFISILTHTQRERGHLSPPSLGPSSTSMCCCSQSLSCLVLFEGRRVGGAELRFQPCTSPNVSVCVVAVFWRTRSCTMDWSSSVEAWILAEGEREIIFLKKAPYGEKHVWVSGHHHGRGRRASGERCPRHQRLGPAAAAPALRVEWNGQHGEGLRPDAALPPVGKFDLTFSRYPVTAHRTKTLTKTHVCPAHEATKTLETATLLHFCSPL